MGKKQCNVTIDLEVETFVKSLAKKQNRSFSNTFNHLILKIMKKQNENS